MREPTFCICENKDAGQLRSSNNCEADQHICFTTRILQLSDEIPITIILLSKSKIPASSHLLCLYSPVRKPHRWFSHEAANLLADITNDHYYYDSSVVMVHIISSPEPSGSQGELIVYPCSVVRPSVVRRPSSVRRPHFSKIFSSETAWPIKAKFYMKHLWEGGTNVYINNPGHMTKMAAMPIYGKNPSKIFFSGTTGPISTKLGMKH